MMQHPQHQMQRDRDPQLPTGMPGPAMPNQPDPMQHLPHPMSAGSLDRPQPPRFMDNPSGGAPFGFRHSPADLTRPHTAFSPAAFPPRGTPTSMPNNLPMFPPNNLPPGIEQFLMQYQMYNNSNNMREREQEQERERERERQERQERQQEQFRRMANVDNFEQCYGDLHRRILAGQHHSYPDPIAGGHNAPGLPPPMLHNPSSPNPAALAGMMAGFPPGGDAGRELFNERMQSDALFRLQMGQCPDLSQAQAAQAALSAALSGQLGHLNGPHNGPGGGPPNLGMPPHSQADAMNPLNFPGAPGVRPMLPGRDQYFNPRYAHYGANGPYGAPSPFFGLGGPHAP